MTIEQDSKESWIRGFIAGSLFLGAIILVNKIVYNLINNDLPEELQKALWITGAVIILIIFITIYLTLIKDLKYNLISTSRKRK